MPSAGELETYTVKEVIDGDTIVVATENGKQVRVRMIGIDAPELQETTKAQMDAEHGEQDLGEILSMGQRARNYLTDELQIKSFPDVYLEYDRNDLDGYGNTLAYVHVCPIAVAYPPEKYMKCPKCITSQQGQYCYLLNALIVHDGYAWIAPVPPNNRYSKLLNRLYVRAKREYRGLWSKPTTGKPVVTKIEFAPKERDISTMQITEDKAVSIAREYADQRGYPVPEDGSAPISATLQPEEKAWMVHVDFAPNSGGTHLNIWVHENSGEVVKFESRVHLR